MSTATVRALGRATDELVTSLEALRFVPPVHLVYDPLVYARAMHDAYVARYARRGVRALWLGMNPGPWGMAQTGVPFGEVAAVRDWMGLSAPIGQPPVLHPKRPVEGLACRRSEVSGKRLWGFAREAFGTPEAFFERFFVWNYCPLVFFAEDGENLTPDKLRGAGELFAACDRALAAFVAALDPPVVVGVGAFAEKRLAAVVGESRRVGRIPHPSPASPTANKDWAASARAALEGLGLLAEATEGRRSV